MKPMDSNSIIQVGIVVRDIEATAKRYCAVFGLPMPNIRNAMPNVNYRGTDITTGSRLCSFEMGNITLELVQPDDGPSSWREFLDAKGEGVHHIGLWVKDQESAFETLKANGVEKRQMGVGATSGYCMVDSAELLGVLLNVKWQIPAE